MSQRSLQKLQGYWDLGWGWSVHRGCRMLPRVCSWSSDSSVMPHCLTLPQWSTMQASTVALRALNSPAAITKVPPPQKLQQWGRKGKLRLPVLDTEYGHCKFVSAWSCMREFTELFSPTARHSNSEFISELSGHWI